MSSAMTQSTTEGEYSRTLKVFNRMGIHARPAAMIVRVANNFETELWVEKDGEQVNGKSIMGLMMLAAGQGSKLRFIATGDAAMCDTLLNDLEDLFTRKFDEA